MSTILYPLILLKIFSKGLDLDKLPFGSERHVHKWSKYLKITQNLQKQWIMWYQCAYCPEKAYIKLEHLPLDESRLNTDGTPKVGVWFGEDDKIHILS